MSGSIASTESRMFIEVNAVYRVESMMEEWERGVRMSSKVKNDTF